MPGTGGGGIEMTIIFLIFAFMFYAIPLIAGYFIARAFRKRRLLAVSIWALAFMLSMILPALNGNISLLIFGLMLAVVWIVGLYILLRYKPAVAKGKIPYQAQYDSPN